MPVCAALSMTKALLQELEVVLDAILPEAPAGWTVGPTVRPKQRQVMRCFERGDVRALVFIAHKAGEDALCVAVASKGRPPSGADLDVAEAAFSPWGGPARREDLEGKTLLYWTVSDIRRHRPRLLLVPGHRRQMRNSAGGPAGATYRRHDVN